MNRIFKDVFDLSYLKGPKGMGFKSVDDAFQQLVGDGLIETFGPHQAIIMPTRGNDGAIDAFVDASAYQKNVNFPPVVSPIIVECKSHDSNSAHLRDNLFKAWEKTKKTLILNASLGWPDLYAPWLKARTYLYCISVTITSIATREKLRSNIEEYLLRERGLLIEKVVIWDWNQIKVWLNSIPRVCDNWLGIGSLFLRTHEEHSTSLKGLQEYLLPDALPFVAPDDHNELHPYCLFNRAINLANQFGLLLVGPGGVGKTRAIMEIGDIAYKNGWRVIHVVPTKTKSIENQMFELIDEVLRGNVDTLLVCDYFDQLQFDLNFIRRNLFPEARKRGMKLALIGNIRPGCLRRHRHDWDDVFEQIEYNPSEPMMRRISDSIISHVASTAINCIDVTRIKALCGVRPIITLLVAREVESLAKSNNLNDESLKYIKNGELRGWLQKRLVENDLCIPLSNSQLVPPEPPIEIIAAATVLAMGPQLQYNLQQVARVVLKLPPTEGINRASYLINILIANGWLEPREFGFGPCHDVVADLLLDEILHPSPGILRVDLLEKILTPCLKSCACLTNISTTLRRMVGRSDDSQLQLSDVVLEKAVSNWLKESMQQLYNLFFQANPHEGSLALGAMISFPPWGELTAHHLLEYWLDYNNDTVSARHVLYSGLRNTAEGDATYLISAAERWLINNGRHLSASFVLNALLLRNDLKSSEDFIINTAWDWLTENGTGENAQFVLHPLLKRLRHQGCDQDQIETTVTWLKKHSKKSCVRFPLREILMVDDLKGYQNDIFKITDDWISIHGGEGQARYVLHALLQREDLSEYVAKTQKYAVDWLSSYWKLPDSGYIVEELLRQDNLGQHEHKVLEITKKWLELHPDSPIMQYVLTAATAHMKVSDGLDLITLLIRRQITWLNAPSMLCHYLKRKDLSKEDEIYLDQIAVEWLSNNLDSDYFHSVMQALFRKQLFISETLNRAVILFSRRMRNYPPGINNSRRYGIMRAITGNAHLLKDENKDDLVNAIIYCFEDNPRIAAHGLKIIEPLIISNSPVGKRALELLQKIRLREEKELEFRQLCKRLQEIAIENNIEISMVDLQTAIYQTEKAITEGMLHQSLWAIPSLMILAFHNNDEKVMSSILKILTVVNDTDNVSSYRIRGMVTACYEMCPNSFFEQYTTIDALLKEMLNK